MKKLLAILLLLSMMLTMFACDTADSDDNGEAQEEKDKADQEDSDGKEGIQKDEEGNLVTKPHTDLSPSKAYETLVDAKSGAVTVLVNATVGEMVSKTEIKLSREGDLMAAQFNIEMLGQQVEESIYTDVASKKTYAVDDDGAWYWTDLNEDVNWQTTLENMLESLFESYDIGFLLSDDSYDKEGDRYSITQDTIEGYLEAIEAEAANTQLEGGMTADGEVYTYTLTVTSSEDEQSVVTQYVLTLDLSAADVTIPADALNAPYKDENDVGGEEEDDDQTERPDLPEIVFEETVVVDNEECTVKITDMRYDEFRGFVIETELENKSADTKYTFSDNGISVNGVQCDALFWAQVEPGQKTVDEIYFWDDTLSENGIVKFTDIEISLYVRDSDDYSADPVVTETVRLYPHGEDQAETFVRESQPTDNVVIDNEYVTMIVTGYGHDDIWGHTANVFLVNKTDKTVAFNANDVMVNGIAVDPIFYKTVAPGKCLFDTISWDDEDFEAAGITEIEVIEMQLRVSDYNDWMADDLVNETVTLNP